MDRRVLSAVLTLLTFIGAAYFPGWKGSLSLILMAIFGIATTIFVVVEHMATISSAPPIIIPSAQELAALKQAQTNAAPPAAAPIEPHAAPPTAQIPPAAPKPIPPKPLTGRAVFDLGEDGK
jgi:hypothetical protein